MRIHETDLKDARLIGLEPLRDNRGFFARTFCEREFAAHGMHTSFPQHSISHTATKASIRGMHFQRTPKSEIQNAHRRALTGIRRCSYQGRG